MTFTSSLLLSVVIINITDFLSHCTEQRKGGLSVKPATHSEIHSNVLLSGAMFDLIYAGYNLSICHPTTIASLGTPLAWFIPLYFLFVHFKPHFIKLLHTDY